MKKLLVNVVLSTFLIFAVVFGGVVLNDNQAKDENLPSSIISLKANGVMTLASNDGIAWPGSAETSFYDKSAMFTAEASGIDFYNGQICVVENGDGIVWLLNVAKNGNLTFVNGYEKGKETKFKSNSGSSKGVDAEGITFDGDGNIYISTERDLANKKVPNNSIIKLNPNSSSDVLVGVEEWNLTSSMPTSSDSNAGLEAVEWVSNAELEGKLYDNNKKGLFNSANYPKQTANGVFFVALESNGHVYGYVLNNDGTFVQIADIDAGFGCAMALDYDVSQNVLWIVTDNNGKNMSAQVVFNGGKTPTITKVKPISTLDDGDNYEGFAIAPDEYAVNGERPVYKLRDGFDKEAMAVGKIKVDYTSTGGNGGNSSGGNQNSASGGNSSGGAQTSASGGNSSGGAQTSASSGNQNGGNSSHSHSYSNDWKANGNEHYHGCSCGAKIDVQNHQIITVNEKPATQTEFGYTGDKVCSVCNYVVEKGRATNKLSSGNGGNNGENNEGNITGGCSASAKPTNFLLGFFAFLGLTLILVRKQRKI